MKKSLRLLRQSIVPFALRKKVQKEIEHLEQQNIIKILPLRPLLG